MLGAFVAFIAVAALVFIFSLQYQQNTVDTYGNVPSLIVNNTTSMATGIETAGASAATAFLVIIVVIIAVAVILMFAWALRK
jgi:hypothetical protein